MSSDSFNAGDDGSRRHHMPDPFANWNPRERFDGRGGDDDDDDVDEARAIEKAAKLERAYEKHANPFNDPSFDYDDEYFNSLGVVSDTESDDDGAGDFRAAGDGVAITRPQAVPQAATTAYMAKYFPRMGTEGHSCEWRSLLPRFLKFLRHGGSDWDDFELCDNIFEYAGYQIPSAVYEYVHPNPQSEMCPECKSDWNDFLWQVQLTPSRSIHCMNTRDLSMLKKFLSFYTCAKPTPSLGLIYSVLVFSEVYGCKTKPVVDFAKKHYPHYDVTSRDRRGRTLMAKLCDKRINRGCRPMIGVIVKNSAAALHVRDVRYNLPIHNAISSCKAQRVSPLQEFLLHGADPNARSRKGKTPLQLAMKYGEGVLLKKVRPSLFLLLRAGADVNDDDVIASLMIIIENNEFDEDLQRLFALLHHSGLSRRLLRRHLLRRCQVMSRECRCEFCATNRRFAALEARPETLQFMCRVRVRKQLVQCSRRSLLQCVAELQIPVQMKKALKLEYV